jgi:hypothetical protein
VKLKMISLAMLCATSSVFADSSDSVSQLQMQINALQAQVNQLEQTNQSALSNQIGLDTADPFGTLSKVNMPLQLVKNRTQNSAPLTLGGQIETDLQYWNGNTIPTHATTQYEQGSSVALTKLYLFTQANLGQDALGFISLKNGSNSSVVVDRAFLMLGDLNSQTPLFLTAGSTYLPFGMFSGNGPLNNTLITNVYRVSPTNQVSGNAILGPVTLIASAYNNQSTVNNTMDGLFTLEFAKNMGQFHTQLGASYLSNIVGTASGLGGAFSEGAADNPAWDANFNVGVSAISLLGEYASTVHGATIRNQNTSILSSWMLGVSGHFSLLDSPYFWQLSDSGTHNMQEVAMPLDGNFQEGLKTLTGFNHQWIGSVQGEYWKNVYVGPELTYGALYTGQDTYTATLDATAYF